MLELLNTKIFDNERNILNADLFVSNLHNTLKAFGFNPKVTYEVYRSITVYHITWNDDKIYDDILELKKEIALSLGINVSDLVMNKVKDYEIFIRVVEKEMGDKYQIMTPEINKNYACCVTKFQRKGTKLVSYLSDKLNCDQCIFIDVFPFDYIAPTKRKEKAQQIKTDLLDRLNY